MNPSPPHHQRSQRVRNVPRYASAFSCGSSIILGLNPHEWLLVLPLLDWSRIEDFFCKLQYHLRDLIIDVVRKVKDDAGVVLAV